MFEIAPNRFIVANRIVTANIYKKDNVIKVAIEMDTVNAEARTQYSAAFAEETNAKAFIANMNSHL